MTPKSGRVIAWLSFALGIAASVAGNVMHSALTPAGKGELVGAALWPLFLMLSIEILTRTRWQLGKRWMTTRVLGVFLVGLVAAVLSYRHLTGLMLSWGEDRFNSHLGPLAVDGLMLLAATALLSISHEKKQAAELPEEWRGTPEEISQKAFARGAAAERVAQQALPGVRVTELKDDTQGIGYTAVPIDDSPSLSGSVKPVKAKAEPQRLHIVDKVSARVADDAIIQAWVQSEGKASYQQIADMVGSSKATVGRKIKAYTESLADTRILR